jgi:predicted DCC family thiol-disulfide oxidoreductase YuxK
MKPNQQRQQQSILLIDGECVLCSRIARFVVKRDRKERFMFAALQSAAGRRLLQQGGLPLHDLDTFVLVQHGHCHVKSKAALLVLRGLGGLWPLLYGLIIVPAAWRNQVYDWVARSRYRWFGKTDICMLPSEQVRQRFLEDGY